MEQAKTARIWITSLLMAALVAFYGYWLVTETPAYWETFLFVTLLFLLFVIALIRFVPYLQIYLATGSEPHLERVGDRTYRRCGVRELAKVILLIVLLRLLQMLLTYLIHLYLFGYTDTFLTVQRLWLDFFHAEYTFPAYPLLSNIFWFVSFNFNHARFLASYAFTALAGATLYYWTLLDFDRPVARRVLLYFFLMPASCLLLGTLPDSLLLLFSLLCLMFARKKRFVLGNIFAMLAVMTHIFGVLLFVPNIIGFIEKLIAELIPLGFAAVMLYSRIQFGSSTALFRTAMDAYGYELSTPFHSVAALVDRFLTAMHTLEGEALLKELGTVIPNMVYLVIGGVLLVFASGRIRTSYIAYMLVAYTAVLCTGTVSEAPRLLSICVPFVLTLSLVTKQKWLHRLLYVLSFIVFLLYLTAVVGGYTHYGR